MAQLKRPPICGTLSLVITVFAWYLAYSVPPTSVVFTGNSDHGMKAIAMFLYSCTFTGFILAIVALALRERFWGLLLVALLLDLALAGYLACGVVFFRFLHGSQ